MQDMAPEKRTLKVLSDAQVRNYHEHGYLGIEAFVDAGWLAKLQDVTQHMIEDSRTVTETNDKFDVEPDHTPDAPRLRRLMKPQDQDPVYTEFAMNGPIVDIAEEEIRDRIRGTFLEGCETVRVSSVTGDGLDLLKDSIGKIASGLQGRPAGEVFGLFPDRVFTVSGFGTVVTGSVLGGSLGVGGVLLKVKEAKPLPSSD